MVDQRVKKKKEKNEGEKTVLIRSPLSRLARGGVAVSLFVACSFFSEKWIVVSSVPSGRLALGSEKERLAEI